MLQEELCPDWVFSHHSNVHVAKSRGWFTTFIPFKTEVRKRPAHNYEEWKVLGIGTVELSLKKSPHRWGDKAHNIVVLQEVLYIPSAPYNLVGVTNTFRPRVDFTSTAQSQGTLWNERGHEIGYFPGRFSLPAFQISGPPRGPIVGRSQFYSNPALWHVITIWWPSNKRQQWHRFRIGRQRDPCPTCGNHDIPSFEDREIITREYVPPKSNELDPSPTSISSPCTEPVPPTPTDNASDNVACTTILDPVVVQAIPSIHNAEPHDEFHHAKQKGKGLAISITELFQSVARTQHQNTMAAKAQTTAIELPALTTDLQSEPVVRQFEAELPKGKARKRQARVKQPSKYQPTKEQPPKEPTTTEQPSPLLQTPLRYTPEEKLWLQKHYGNEYKFLLINKLSVHVPEERNRGRILVRNLMAEEKEKEAQEAASNGPLTPPPDDDKGYHSEDEMLMDNLFSIYQLRFIEANWKSVPLFMRAHGLRYPDVEDCQLAQTLLIKHMGLRKVSRVLNKNDYRHWQMEG